MAAIFVVLTILVLLGVDALVSRRRNQLVPVNAGPIDHPTPEPGLPAGLFLHPGHAWVEVQRSGAVRVGLDEFLRHVMGAPDRLVMRRAGDEVRQGEPLLTLVRDGRQLVLRAPVSGTIDLVNQELEARPQTLTRSVYGPNWAYAIRPSRLGEEIGGLQVSERASRWLGAEMRRWTNWFGSLAPASPGMAVQDGGEPVSGALSQVDETAWSGFQSEFLDRRTSV